MKFLDEQFTQSIKLHVLSCAFVCAVIVLFPSQCDSFKAVNFRCKSLGTCRCAFENEEGYDLSELSVNKYGLNATKDNLTFYFHPCTDISIGSISDLNDCYEGVSICLYNHTRQSYTNLGFSNETNVTSDGLTGPATFVYTHHPNSSFTSVTSIHLQCERELGSSLEVASTESSNNYELVLRSPSACHQRLFVEPDPPAEASHLSTGSVLVIMLIVFSSLYFVGGALALKLLRGAEGREMIPNYDFWVSLPGLVKEGFMFTISGCRTPQAYDRI